MKKRILIDLSAYNEKLGGFTRVSLDLLGIINTIDDFDFYVLCHIDFEKEFSKYKNINIISRKYPISLRFFVNSFILPGIIRRYKIDAVHFEINFSFSCRTPFSLSIHDLYFLDTKKDVIRFSIKSKIMSLYWNLFFFRNIKRAALIRAISYATRDELLAFVPEKKIRCIYNYVKVQEKYTPKTKLPDPLKVVFIGNQLPRKNLPFLLQSLSLLKRPFELHTIGKSYEYTEQLCSQYNFPIIMHGFVGESAKQSLLSQMDILVIPSLKEGFGLTIFEAYDNSVLTLAANNSSLMELLPQNCLFELDNPEGLASMIENINIESYNLLMQQTEQFMISVRNIDYPREYKIYFKDLVKE